MPVCFSSLSSCVCLFLFCLLVSICFSCLSSFVFLSICLSVYFGCLFWLHFPRYFLGCSDPLWMSLGLIPFFSSFCCCFSIYSASSSFLFGSLALSFTPFFHVSLCRLVLFILQNSFVHSCLTHFNFFFLPSLFERFTYYFLCVCVCVYLFSYMGVSVNIASVYIYIYFFVQTLT